MLRSRLGLMPTDELRISYITGPGDVVGTYEQWKNGQTDARVPIFAYSTMFYELASLLDGHGQLLCEVEPPSDCTDPFQFVRLPSLSYRGRIGYRLGQSRRIRATLAAMDAFRPHLIVASSHVPATAWPALSRRAPVILSIHNTFWPMGRPLVGIQGNLKYRLLRRQATYPSSAVCISNECARQVSGLTDGRVAGRLVCPQIPSTYLETPRQRARRLLFIGRVEENKGVFLLLEAFASLMRDHPDLSLSFAGAGSADFALRERVEALGSSRVKLLGRLSAQGIHQAISEADLLVCPTMTSFNEGLAVVGFEAASHGVPSVLSSVVPAKDLLAPCALVFPANDGAALRACLSELIEKDATYAELVRRTADVCDLIYDRSRSWGSQLYLAMLDAVGAA